jgi:pimeloyl-ACP methyl ester carboxylesterase
VEERVERFGGVRLRGVHLCAVHRGEPSHPLLVLLHGAGANAHWWDHVAPALAEAHHVVALDFRGHGDSDYPDEVRSGAFVEDLEALLEHLGRPEPILVGHSMGGAVALEHAARRGKTRALALLDVARGGTAATRRTLHRALRVRFAYRNRDQAIARFRFVPPAQHAPEALRRAIASHSVRELPDGGFGFKFDPRWFALPPHRLPSLSSVHCPTLLVRGAESALLTQQGAEELLREIPGAELALIPQAGHHVHLDAPEAVLASLLAFLRDLA